MRRGLIGGGVFAALWFLFGWAPRVLSSSDGRLAALARVIPSPMSRGVFGASPLWMIVVQVLMAVAAIAGFALLVSGLSAGRTSFASGWLAAILTAVVIGAALDLGSFFSEVGSLGIRGAISTMGTAPLTAWWAVWAGWIPALVTMRPGSAVVRRRAGVPVWGAIALTTVVALIALPFAAEAGHRASQEQLREDLAAEEAAARANADPDGAASPDPDAIGEPVPTAAFSEKRPAADACTSENTTSLAPAPDAATGHRAQALTLVNVSEEPCVVDGYPDVAYGDQNGHLLDVAIEHGRSFMAEDPGASPITLQAGESASAVIGWDANSVLGQLAARSVWIAVVPGQERLAWDVSFDIVPGAAVTVTAWYVTASSEG
jgi:hypothetical protein